MKSSLLRARYLRIMYFFVRTVLGFIFWEIFLAKIGFRAITRKTRSNRLKNLATQFRILAIRMGGVMIKVGQFLSSRLDVLPKEIIEELSGLQDEVPPELFTEIERKAEQELGAALTEKYEFFEETPLAAASLGQVHRARLCVTDGNGEYCNVVVKIQRPHIEELIETDLSALRQVGEWLKLYPPIAKRADVPALMQEFSDTIREEVDYLAEGRNAEIFAKNFNDVKRVHVPRVVWSHTTRRVLTLEDVFAIKITDYNEISSAGINRAEVASELLDIYLKQIFEDGFFHADPHPGNLFITPLPRIDDSSPTDWQLTFVDFGMVGRVPKNLQTGLREVLISIGTRDATRLVRSYQTLDVLLDSADLKLIERATAQVFGMLWGKSMNELREIDHREMFKFADQFRELMYDMPFQLPQNLLLLGRTIAILSGMCTGLYSEFNLWEQLAPYATKLITMEAGSNWQSWLGEIGNVLKELIALPSQAGRVLSQVERGDLIVQAPTMTRQIQSLERSIHRLTTSIVFGILFLGGILLYNAGNELPAQFSLGFSGIVLFWLFFFNRGNSRRFHP